jgi:hypothetical protein
LDIGRYGSAGRSGSLDSKLKYIIIISNLFTNVSGAERLVEQR